MPQILQEFVISMRIKNSNISKFGRLFILSDYYTAIHAFTVQYILDNTKLKKRKCFSRHLKFILTELLFSAI